MNGRIYQAVGVSYIRADLQHRPCHTDVGEDDLHQSPTTSYDLPYVHTASGACSGLTPGTGKYQ